MMFQYRLGNHWEVKGVVFIRTADYMNHALFLFFIPG
jgi:hypothetical protein